MNKEQPKVVGAGTSLNKEYWKSKEASYPPVYSVRGIRAYDELQTVVTEVGQVKQTVTTSYTYFVMNSGIMLWIQHVMEVFYV